MDEPLLTKRSGRKSVAGQAGCASNARITAGTSRLVLGRKVATSCSQALASNRGCSLTAAPTASAGSTWMHSPPTWHSGSTASTRSAALRPCTASAMSILASMPRWLCSTPLGWPLLPEV